jgi:hypothetical protein
VWLVCLKLTCCCYQFYDAAGGVLRATQTPMFTPTQATGTFNPMQGIISHQLINMINIMDRNSTPIRYPKSCLLIQLS